MRGLVAIHQRLVARIDLYWWETVIFVLLIPISILYGTINWLRNFLYSSRLISSYRSVLPIVSVGNIAVGGTGKTPVVDWLIKEFQRAGKCPAVVSRGYSGNFSGTVGLVSDGQQILMAAQQCGDEPYLLAKRNRLCPVAISRKRSDGIRFLEKRGGVDVVILDDGFQHLAVQRDVDIVLIDERNPIGNGWPLPAGNLREFPFSLNRADFLLMTRSDHHEKVQFRGKTIYQSDHQLSDVAVDLTGETIPLSDLKSLKLCAFAGIATPEVFFNSLESKGLSLNKTLSFGDHVKYDESLVESLRTTAKDSEVLITTEKDGVKLTADMFELPCYQVPVDVQIAGSSELFAEIVQRLWSC